MKQFMIKLLRPAMWTMLTGAFMMACQTGNDVSPKSDLSGATLASKSQMIATSQDVLGITSDALSGEGISAGGRVATISNHPHWGHHDGCRPTITRTIPKITGTADSLTYSGSVTIDYGQGNCGGDSTAVHIHKGKITDSFTLTAIVVNDSTITETSTQTITFSGWSCDSVQLDGTIISKVAANTTTVEIHDVKMTYADGSSITWSGTLTYTYDNGGTRLDISDDTKSISGSLTGLSSDGISYSNNITKPIIYKFSCMKNKISAPVSGTLEVNAGGTTSIIDYGDGTCDTTYTITTAGSTTSHTF